MWYFYVLYSDKDAKYYYGSTNDLKRRLAEHTAGKVKSTKPRLPIQLVYYEAFQSEEKAHLREQRIKSSRGTRLALHKRI